MAPETGELSGHHVTAWTAGQLRAALNGVPNDLPVVVITAEDDEQVVTAAGPWAHAEGSADDVRARIATGELRADHFEICLELPQGDDTGEETR